MAKKQHSARAHQMRRAYKATQISVGDTVIPYESFLEVLGYDSTHAVIGIWKKPLFIWPLFEVPFSLPVMTFYDFGTLLRSVEEVDEQYDRVRLNSPDNIEIIEVLVNKHTGEYVQNGKKKKAKILMGVPEQDVQELLSAIDEESGGYLSTTDFKAVVEDFMYAHHTSDERREILEYYDTLEEPTIINMINERDINDEMLARCVTPSGHYVYYNVLEIEKTD